MRFFIAKQGRTWKALGVGGTRRVRGQRPRGSRPGGQEAAYQTFSIQVSTDNGQMWRTLAIGLKDPAVKLDRRQFREGQDVQVRVLATNGLTISVVAIESFRVLPRKPDPD